MSDSLEGKAEAVRPRRIPIVAILWLLVYIGSGLLLFREMSPMIAYLISAVLAFWVVAGRGEIWWKSLFSAGILGTTAYYSPEATGEGLDNHASQMLIIFISSIFITLMLSLLLPRMLGVPRRISAPVSLKDIGGWFVMLGLIFAFIHHLVSFDRELQNTFTWTWNNGLLFLVPIALAVSVGSSWQLLPKSERVDRTVLSILGLTIIVSPILCSFVMAQFFVDWNPFYHTIELVIFNGLLGGAASLLIYPLECIGIFSSELSK